MTTTLNSALQTLNRDFAAYDSALKGDASKTDGLISLDDLRQVADNVGNRFTPEQQEAARFLLDNPAQLNFVDAGPGGGKIDGMIDRAGLNNAAGLAGGDKDAALNAMLDTAASRNGEIGSDNIHGTRDINSLLMDPGLNPDLRTLLQGRSEADIRAKLGQLIDPLSGEQRSGAQQQNLATLGQATELLANTVQGMNPKDAAALVGRVWPDLQSAIGKNYNNGASFENKTLLEQTGRIAAVVRRSGDTALFDRLVQDAGKNPALSMVTPSGSSGTAQMTLNDQASMQGLPLYLALAKKDAANGVSEPYALVNNIIRYNNSQIADLTQKYNNHTKDLAWFVSNQGKTASPEELQKAINNYVNAQGPQWRATYQSLQNQLTDRGAQLLDVAGQIRTTLPEADARALTESMFGAKETQFAVKMALNGRPEIAADPTVAATRDWMAAAAGGGGSGFKALPQIAQALGTAYLRREVGDALKAGMNPPDPQRLLTELESLKQPGLARSLGMSEGALNQAITQLQTLNTDIANGNLRTPDELRAFIDNHINGELAGQEAFAADTAHGQVFRTLATTVSALSFAKSTGMAVDDPSFINVVNASAQGFDVAQQVLQMSSGAGLISESGPLGRYAGNAGVTKLLGSVGVALDAVGAVDAFDKGDNLQGALQTVSALGGAVAIFGAGSAWGPAGAIVGGLAALASLGVSMFREKAEADKHQNDTNKQFLRDVGYNPQAADILYDNSGEGLSPLPLLMKYGADRGLTPQQTRDLLNSLGSDYGGELLWKMRDVAHKVLDSVDGDLSKLNGAPLNSQLQESFNNRAEIWARQNGVTLSPR
ncbi:MULTISPECIES: hypothetical protein [unclassified Lysobacter]|uniref:hypothetical protein n=1 Tax=unclassified Lysobacter TaxID=2635362 RepID=UPI001BE9C425|nr:MULTISPECIES: hypothetical protein [unclassified Lysobacter]MBT2744783.1 hypothetical protein [Lysobacter sp. ISL-42]MBT2752224.1 hypothetical protein [Lysobacter sp. ISL-50]MBT2778721.1 hypothetical protein [Lysobacter sp. ISL-54]MBT2780348.1 hypothetical protein [Lysobacter sp. ISL-52]